MIRRRRRGERGSHACSPSYMTTAGPASLPDWPYKSTPALALDEGAHIGTVQLLVSRPTLRTYSAIWAAVTPPPAKWGAGYPVHRTASGTATRCCDERAASITDGDRYPSAVCILCILSAGASPRLVPRTRRIGPMLISK